MQDAGLICWCETMTSLTEARAALIAARNTGRAVIVTSLSTRREKPFRERASCPP